MGEKTNLGDKKNNQEGKKSERAKTFLGKKIKIENSVQRFDSTTAR